MSVGGVGGADFDPVSGRPLSGGVPAIPAPEAQIVRGGPGPRNIDLFPREVLWNVAAAGLPQTAPVAPKNPAFDFSPADPATAERNRTQYLGPTYAALTMDPRSSDFGQQISAEAALSMLPAMLLSSVAKPAVDKGYNIIDKIPTALRRPFVKNYGLLIDNALAAASMASFPLVSETMKKQYPNGTPPSANIDMQGYSQDVMACGETAAATIMKAAGEPVALGDVDTQMVSGAGSGLEDTELRRRGLSAVSGFGDMDKLKGFLAAGYPVMVSVGWESGGGHYVVVSGYDEAKGTVTIKNWDDAGGTNTVDMKEFAADWGRHKNAMTAVVPARDPRLDSLVKASTSLRRPDQIYPGFSISDFTVTQDKKVKVEAAYRYVGKTTDVTVRVNWNQSNEGLERQLGGSLAIRQEVAKDWYVGMKVEKMSLVGKDDNWHSFSTAPVSVYGSVDGPGFQFKVGTERGAAQASLAADLSKWVSGMGAKVNASVDERGNYQVMGMISGTF